MRILYIEPDINKARPLYSQLLTYKGMLWELHHCSTIQQALEMELHESFDVLLIRVDGNEAVEGQLQVLVERLEVLPGVAILSDGAPELSLEWLRLGFSDCLTASNVSGDLLMRRLRIAISRFHRIKNDVAAANRRVERQNAKVLAGKIHAPSHKQYTPVFPGPYCADAALTSFDINRMERPSKEGAEIRIALLKDRHSLRILDGDCDEQLNVLVFRELNGFLEYLRLNPAQFDCVIIEQDLLEREGIENLSLPELRFPGPPLILLTPERSDANAVSNVESGFDDCLLTSTLNSPLLLRAIRFASTRHECLCTRLRDRLKEEQQSFVYPFAERRSASSSSDRRQTPRYSVTRPLLAIPVLPDGTPDRSGVCEALSVDFAIGGIGLQIANRGTIPSRNWVMGVECNCNDGRGVRFHFAHMLLKNTHYPQAGVRLGAQFQSNETDLFRGANLIPTIQSSTGRMTTGLSAHALEQWAELGVLKRKLYHRINTCPECQGVAAVGSGCHDCGSPHMEFRELIHHFACAYVGEAAEFKRDGMHVCPKCLMDSLVSGADFEVIKSHYECADCNYSGSEVEQVGTCLHCNIRFPMSLAIEEEVMGYDVDRLDVVALLRATN
jgi:Thaumarchaeal output domain 1